MSSKSENSNRSEYTSTASQSISSLSGKTYRSISRKSKYSQSTRYESISNKSRIQKSRMLSTNASASKITMDSSYEQSSSNSSSNSSESSNESTDSENESTDNENRMLFQVLIYFFCLELSKRKILVLTYY